MLGYYCAYFRYYHPVEFITAFLNNAANDEDSKTGATLARLYGIRMSLPKFGYSKGDYFFNSEKKIIAKGVSSVKYLSANVANELYDIAQEHNYTYFVDVLYDICQNTSADARQIDVLRKIDFFSHFGNQRELLRICDIFELFNKGKAKQIKKGSMSDTAIENIVKKYATDKTKSGAEAKSYTLLDVRSIMRECEDLIKSASMPDLSDIIKIKNFEDIMGYAGYSSGKETDRPKLYVKEVYPLKRKSDNAQFGYSIITQSVGSGIESRFTVFNKIYNADPIHKNDVILCKGYQRDGVYFTLTKYEHIYE